MRNHDAGVRDGRDLKEEKDWKTDRRGFAEKLLNSPLGSGSCKKEAASTTLQLTN